MSFDQQRRRETVRRVGELIAARQPNHSLDQAFYVDPDIYALELERIIYRHWFLVGHESEWPSPGDYRRFDVADESAIIVRGNDGELRAFANVCRHRGSRICLEDAGRVRQFSCPYHGWQYGLDGALTAARAMPDDFDPARHGLKPVALDTVHGLVFVAFGEAPPALDHARRDLERPMRWFGFDSMRVASRETYSIPANWKLAIENYQECYHCATAHKTYAARHTLMLAPKNRERVQGGMQDRLAAAGLEDLLIDRIDNRAPAGATGYGYSRTALFDGYLTGSKDGQPLAPLLGELKDYDGGGSDFTFGPFNFMLAYSDHVVVYVFYPVSHTQSKLDVLWLVNGSAEAGRDYDVDALTWLWHETTLEDLRIIHDNWLGVQSKYYEPGPFSELEDAEAVYVDWLLGELLREDAG
jgi:Rieske 2Fe-2S family protein